MKKTAKLILLTAIALASTHVYAEEKKSLTDQEIIEQALLCQNIPAAPTDIKYNTDDEKRLEAYDEQVSAYVSTAEKALSNSAKGKPKKEEIDYSNYTTYQLKQPVEVRGVPFSTVLHIDYEDGYQTFKATTKTAQKDLATFDNFKKTEDLFETEIEDGQFTISCTLVYSLNLPQ